MNVISAFSAPISIFVQRFAIRPLFQNTECYTFFSQCMSRPEVAKEGLHDPFSHVLLRISNDRTSSMTSQEYHINDDILNQLTMLDAFQIFKLG